MSASHQSKPAAGCLPPDAAEVRSAHRLPEGGAVPVEAGADASARSLSLPDSGESISSNELLRGRCCLQILHKGMIYRLQVTRQGKLILTK